MTNLDNLDMFDFDSVLSELNDAEGMADRLYSEAEALMDEASNASSAIAEAIRQVEAYKDEYDSWLDQVREDAARREAEAAESKAKAEAQQDPAALIKIIMEATAQLQRLQAAPAPTEQPAPEPATGSIVDGQLVVRHPH